MPMKLRSLARVAGVALPLALGPAAWAQSPAHPAAETSPTQAGPAEPVVTHHSGTFNGKPVAYDAIVEPIVVSDDAGKPAARLVAITYLATSITDTAQRPVLFVFNGGPIAPSSVLHMGAFGPKRVAIPDRIRRCLTPPVEPGRPEPGALQIRGGGRVSV